MGFELECPPSDYKTFSLFGSTMTFPVAAHKVRHYLELNNFKELRRDSLSAAATYKDIYFEVKGFELTFKVL